MPRRGRLTVNGLRSSGSSTESEQILVMPALGGPEQRLFEASGTECGSLGTAGVAAGRTGFRGRRTASTWSSAIGTPPITSAIYLYSFEDGQRRQLTSPPANLSDIHPVVSPDGRYLAFVRLNPEAAAAMSSCRSSSSCNVSGEPTQLTFGHTVAAFDWTHDSRSIIHDAGPDGARIVASRRRRRRVRARVGEHHGTSMPSVARSGAGVVYQNMRHRREHLGTADAVLPESPTLRGRNLPRYRVDVPRHGYAVLT